MGRTLLKQKMKSTKAEKRSSQVSVSLPRVFREKRVGTFVTFVVSVSQQVIASHFWVTSTPLPVLGRQNLYYSIIFVLGCQIVFHSGLWVAKYRLLRTTELCGLVCQNC